MWIYLLSEAMSYSLNCEGNNDGHWILPPQKAYSIYRILARKRILKIQTVRYISYDKARKPVILYDYVFRHKIVYIFLNTQMTNSILLFITTHIARALITTQKYDSHCLGGV